MDDKPELEFERLAEDCRCQAAGTSHPRTRAVLNEMADEYLQKARTLRAADGAAAGRAG